MYVMNVLLVFVINLYGFDVFFNFFIIFFLDKFILYTRSSSFSRAFVDTYA